MHKVAVAGAGLMQVVSVLTKNVSDIGSHECDTGVKTVILAGTSLLGLLAWLNWARAAQRCSPV